MKKIFIFIIIICAFIVVGCEKEYEYTDDVYNIGADTEFLAKSLRKIIVDYQYKRLTKNLKLPKAVEGEIPIEWSISDCDNVVISANNTGEYLKITRDDTEFIHFKLYAKILDDDGNTGVRYWDCYITPLCYLEEN